MAPGPESYSKLFISVSEMRPWGISLMLSVGSTMESDLDIINPMRNSSVQVPHTHPAFCLLVVSLYIYYWI